MKVMCIDNSAPVSPGHPTGFMPTEGVAYTSQMVTTHSKWPVDTWHILNEDPAGWYWNTKFFIPLSEIDETELIKERETQLIRVQ